MRKILILFATTLLFSVGYSQTTRTFPAGWNTQPLGGSNTVSTYGGIIYPKFGYASAVWSDTTAMNNSPMNIKNIMMFRASTVDGKNWIRAVALNVWLEELNSSSSGAGTVTDVAALTLGTSGTDLSSSVANGTTTPVITLNVPTASASNRGALSAADWITFNAKQSALTFTSPLVNTAGTVAVGGLSGIGGALQLIRVNAGATAWEYFTPTYGTPAGNYGNVQLNRNSLLATPASDSLDFDAGLSIKGGLTVTSLPSGASTDSAVVYNNTTKVFNKKVAVVINTAGRSDGDFLEWDAGANEYISVVAPANAWGFIRFQTGVTGYAPEAGDSIFVHTGMTGKRVLVTREGLLLDSSLTDGWTFSVDTLKFHPPLADSERVTVRVYTATDIEDLALEATSSEISFNSVTNVIESSPGVWVASNSGTSYGQTGLDNVNVLPASTDGYIYMTWNTGDGNGVLGFNTANAETGYAGMETGILIGGPTSVNVIEAGVPALVGGATIANGDLIRIRRTGSTMYLEKSTDNGVSWGSVLYTFSTTSSATLYPVCDIYNGSPGVVRNPKIFY